MRWFYRRLVTSFLERKLGKELYAKLRFASGAETKEESSFR